MVALADPTPPSARKLDCSMAEDTQPSPVKPHSTHAETPGQSAKDIPGLATSFLDLPAEIRNMVYDYLFPTGESAVQLLARRSGKGFIAMSGRLGLLTTCRQVYGETTSFLRVEKRLQVKEPKTLRFLIEATTAYPHHWRHSPNPLIQHLIPAQGLDLHFDVDNNGLTRNVTGLMNTSRWYRNLFFNYAKTVGVTAKSSTNLLKSDFGGFANLQPWIDVVREKAYARYYDDDPNPLIVLNFALDFQANFQDVRYEATSLVKAVSEVHLEYPYVHLQMLVSHRGSPQSTFVSVDEIEERLMVFLWLFIQDHPEKQAHTCPRTWFDGSSWPREAEFTDEWGFVHIWLGEVGQVSSMVEEIVGMLFELDPRKNYSIKAIDKGSLLGVALELAGRMAERQ